MAQTISLGTNVIVPWEANRRSKQPGAVKSNKTELGKTKKIILPVPDARGIQPKAGELWVCRVERILSPKAENHGAILVRPLSRKLEFQFKGVYIEPLKAQLMATVLQDPRLNLMLEGDHGVGKSTAAAAIADTLGWDYRKISCGLIKKFVYMLGRYVPCSEDSKPVPAASMSEELLQALKKYKPQKEDGTLGFSSPDSGLLKLLFSHMGTNSLSFKWIDSKLVEVLREAARNPGKVFLLMLDEYTRMDEDARDALLDVIAGNQRVLRLPTGEEVPVPSNVKFMAAGNVGDGYTLKREDAAAKDRWVIIKMFVMPQPEELEHCLSLYPGAPREELNRALSIISAVRKARKDRKMRLSKIVSTRGAETTASLLSAGFAIHVALETAVVNQYAGTADDQTSEAGRVAKLISEELAKKPQ